MKTIHLAHSPDADDAFMFYGLAKGFVKDGDIAWTHVLYDIETLNQKALQGLYEVTALSVHAYAYVSDRYDILRHGASIGENYGPIIISKEPLKPDEIRNRVVAVPGAMTTAYLALRLFDKDIQTVTLPFDQIVQAVEKGHVYLGLIIHEGQLTFSKNKLHKILDLGQWWHEKTGLPLPLGINGIRKDLQPPLRKKIASLLKESICYGLAHRKETLAHALQFGRGIEPALADRFINMYVNEETVQMSDRTIKAIELLLTQAHESGIIPRQVVPSYV